MRLTRNGIPDLNDSSTHKWQASDYVRPKDPSKPAEPEEPPLDFEGRPVHDLMYHGDAAPEILARFPNAKITDASDFIHERRIEVDVEGITWDEWFLFMFESGIGGHSLATQLTIRTHPQYLKRLLKL